MAIRIVDSFITRGMFSPKAYRHPVRLLALPAAFALGAIASRLILRTAPSRFQIDLAQPLPVATGWGTYGAVVLAVLAIAIALAGVVYIRQLSAASAPPLRSTLLLCAATLAVGLLWLPLFSSDVYAYAAYGEMARIGLNPYVHTALPNDALLAIASWQWRPAIPVCVYGEAFVGIARIIATVTAAVGPQATLLTFRALACAALVLCGFMIARCADTDERGKRAAFFLCCNPLVVWSAIEGHNDALMLAVVLAGGWLARAHRFAGTLVVTLAGLIKGPGLLAGIAFARRSLYGFIVGAGLVAAFSYRLIAGVRSNLAPHGHYSPVASVQSLGIFFTFALAIIVLARVRTFEEPIDRSCVLALALWLAIPNPYAWYALWIVPLGALARDRRLSLTTLTVTGAAFLRYIPDAVALPQGATSVALGLIATAAYLPLFGRDIISRS